MIEINFLQNIRVVVIEAAMIVLFCAPTYAENSSSSKLYQLLEETNSISARFHQKISYDLNKSVAEQFLGDFLFLKPNHLRWVIEPPAAQEIFSNGDKIWIHDLELEQVVVHDFNRDLLATPIMLFSSSLEEINVSYSVTEQKAAKQLQHFILKPKSDSSLFTRLELVFFERAISQIIFVSDDQINAFSFSNTKTNFSPALDLFTFDLPKTAEVLYNYER
jgi:outer membrane lipoprotein carrier protein